MGILIPKGRKIEAFEEIEALNDSVLENADILSDKTLTLENEQALQQLGIKLQKFNGIAIASNFNGKEKYLEDFGFIKMEVTGRLSMLKNASQIQAPKNVEPKKKIKDLLAQLLNFLVI